MDRVLLGHGSGGGMMHRLISERFSPAFGMRELGDSALVETSTRRLAFTTDSYVVSPIFFPGGDIGSLAVNGTVNDLAVSGARPLYLSAGFIIEEGFPLADLDTVVSSMARAASEAGVRIVTGDTKVVNRGKGDGIFINTAGVGEMPDGVTMSPKNIKKGDKVIVSGGIGRHGVAVMAERNGISTEPRVLSDTAPLNHLVEAMLKAGAGQGHIRFMRDPTRGGLATSLKEAASESGLCIRIQEDLVPVPDGVRGVCELLGLDLLFVANEGTLVAVVSPEGTEDVLKAMQGHPLGAGAKVIGEVQQSPPGALVLQTSIGGSRLIELPEGEQLPRIC